MSKKVLEVQDLTISFKTNQGYVRAVRGIDFDLYEGETLAIVGESGSGKSVSTRSIMGILAGNAIIDKGKINYEGEDLTKVTEADFHKIRGRKIGMIFQDPLSSLNPIMKIGKQVTEGMIINGKHLKNRIKELSHDAEVKVSNINKRIRRAKDSYKLAIEELKLEKIEKEEFSNKRNELLEKRNTKLQELKLKKPELVKAFRQSRKEAKAIVRNEWQAAKEASKVKVDALKVKIVDLKASGDLEAIKEVKNEISNEREALRRVKKVTQREANEKAVEILTEVGIANPEERMKQYPFQFSGGMRQRIVIAIALTANPEILICDEPTTALDVTIQAQILELIKKIKEDRNLTVIFITHDLGVVANIADRVLVMYAGKIVEYGTVNEIFYNPKHPYTWALLSSMPDLNSADRLRAIPGTPPDMLYPPAGDAFAYRSQYAMEIDFIEEPPFFKVSDTHYAATWLLHEDAPKVELTDIIKDRIEFFEKSMKEGAKNNGK